MGTPPISSAMSRGRGLKCHFISFKLLHCRHFLTPPSYGHLPYILHGKTPHNTTGHSREEGGKYFPRIYFSNRRPLYRFATPRNAMGHGRGGGFKMPLQQFALLFVFFLLKRNTFNPLCLFNFK